MRDGDRNPDEKADEKLDENEGEGSKSAARRYGEQLEEFTHGGAESTTGKNVEELAEEAAKELGDDDLDADEGKDKKVA
ncbi:MAG: hypothetical protein ACAI25_00930 [Planctomycetota bacterium]